MIFDLTTENADIYSSFFKAQGRDDVATKIEGCRWLNTRDTYQMEIALPTLELLKAFRELCKEHNQRGQMILLSSVIGMIENPEKAKVGNSLKALAPALQAFIQNDAIDGWLYYSSGDYHLPYLVTKIEYVAGNKGRSADTDPCVKLEVIANVASSGKNDRQFRSRTFNFYTEDLGGKTIVELLYAKRLMHESPELKKEYEKHQSTFKNYYSRIYEQFWVTGMAFSNSDYDAIGKPMVDGCVRLRALNDEPQIERTFVDDIPVPFWNNQDIYKFSKVPNHPFIFVFLLDVNDYGWAHVSNMTPYEYRPELKDKLILPEDHRDLIDILTADLTILEDIVDGKKGGTTVMCTGKPGTGKTLTAEIYTEVIQKPLYRVHTGMLGTSPEKVEKEIIRVLSRAQRWGCCLLLDECDTWVRERGDDIHQNAIIAAFLRALEASAGLTFLTSNRQDIDDAILSRCIAHIKYDVPNETMRPVLWKTLSDTYGANLSEKTIKEAVDYWPQAVGRDIKELMKLALKFAKKDSVPVDLEILRRCAQFRGL